MGDHPARALGDVPAHPDDDQTHDRADEERDAPAEVLGDAAGVEQPEAGAGAEQRTGPVGAVDGDVDPAAVLGGDQLVDGAVDRGVLAADAQPGDEAPDVEEPGRPGEARHTTADEVDRQRDDEQLLAAQPVGQPSERQRADDLPDEIDGAGQTDLEGRHAQALLEARRRDELDLQPVEDPGDPQPDDDHPVEPRPWQAVHPKRDQAADSAVLGCGRRHRHSSTRTRPRRGGVRTDRLPLLAPFERKYALLAHVGASRRWTLS